MPSQTDLIAAAIANARGGRRGMPPIKNILAVLPQKLVDEVRDEAAAVLSALGQSAELLAALKDGLSLAGGWREAIVELEDWCHEPVRLKNMLAAADQLDRWAKAARDAIDKATVEPSDG